VASGAARKRKNEPTPAAEVNLRGHALAPNLAVLRRWMMEMIARGALVELVAAVLGLLQRMFELNTELTARLASGSRKRPPNESLRRLQMELPLMLAPAANDFEGPPAPAEIELEGPPEPPVQELEGPPAPPWLSPKKRRRKKRGPKKQHLHGRPKFPKNLPRKEDRLCVADWQRCCPKCGGKTKSLWSKVSEKLDIEIALYFIRRTTRETVACVDCREYFCTAEKPDEVVDRGILGNDLLVDKLVDHYDDAVPWERMERSATEQGVPLKANTLASSVGAAIDLFEPVVNHIKEAALASDFTALDATRMPVLDPEHPLGIRSGALWLIEGEHRYACFVYAPSGHASHLEKLLGDRKLASVMCDGSPTNNCVERAGGERGGCNAHARRGLVAALRGGDIRAARGIEIFARLFQVDSDAKEEQDTLEARFARRQERSAPIVEELRTWLEESRAEVEPKSLLGKALGYIARQWNRLTAFLRDPKMELTNNEVERDLRRWVLSRKTWYFVGHELSARRSADALTLLTTCRKMGLDPRRYLRAALAKILAGEKDLVALLPETFARELAAEKLAAEAADTAAAERAAA
jgi:transposase